ncbi:MAG: hypothetical protein ACP5HS_03795 [Anaerolineae bacterium]
MTDAINTYNEKSLHAALKAWYAGATGCVEVPVDGYIVDVVRGDLLIEIQTGNFSSIRDKLTALSEAHPVLLVYPIAQEKWLVKTPKPGSSKTKPSRRKSPKRGTAEEVFPELVSFPALLARPTFGVEIAFTQEEELRHYDKRRGWRTRGWVTDDRRLLDVVGTRRFATPADFASLLPGDLPIQFTTADLARATGRSRRFAQKMAYCLREMGLLVPLGHRRRAILYALAENVAAT